MPDHLPGDPTRAFDPLPSANPDSRYQRPAGVTRGMSSKIRAPLGQRQDCPPSPTAMPRVMEPLVLYGSSVVTCPSGLSFRMSLFPCSVNRCFHRSPRLVPRGS